MTKSFAVNVVESFQDIFSHLPDPSNGLVQVREIRTIEIVDETKALSTRGIIPESVNRCVNKLCACVVPLEQSTEDVKFDIQIMIQRRLIIPDLNNHIFPYFGFG